MSDGQERLHKRIAAAGIASRRAAEKMILEGRVTVNDATITELGFKVGEDDVICVDNRPIAQPKLFYLLMNKPKGIITTMSDPEGRRTVLDLLPDLGATLKPVGRLDKDTEGLLIFTNDGALAQRLTHPKYAVDKEYVVTVRGQASEQALAKLSKGVWIPEVGKTQPASVTRVYRDSKTDRTAFHLTLHEGKKRQVRLMCLAIGHPVKELKRVRVGPIELKGQPRGTCRMLTKPEIDALRSLVGLRNL